MPSSITIAGDVGHTGYAGFMNGSLSTNGTNYALLLATTGHTFLNSSTGKDIRFRVNNSDQMILKFDMRIAKQQLQSSLSYDYV